MFANSAWGSFPYMLSIPYLLKALDDNLTVVFTRNVRILSKSGFTELRRFLTDMKRILSKS